MSCESCQSPRSHVALFEFDRLCRRFDAVNRLVSLQDFLNTSAAGCRRCFLILEAVRKRGSSGDRPVPHFDMPEQYVIGIGDTRQHSKVDWHGIRYGHGSVLDILLCERSGWIKYKDSTMVMSGVYTECVETSDALLIPFASRVSADMSVESCSVHIKLWLERCIDTHPETCPRTACTLPKRVIDVGSHNRRLKIYATEAGEQGTYCALSYCWGESVPFRTETSTYQRLKAGFNLDDLPKTIRDAVLLVRALGIQYLWVDSLCIIQDSVSDWECEAAVMGDIYSRAVIVIAAVDAPDSDTGLFHDDERRHFQRVGADHGSVFMRQNFHNGVTDSHVSQPIKQLTTNALHYRGWTLQEVALASRTVWFKSGEISWSCVRSTACECKPKLLDIVYSDDDNSHLLQTIPYLQSSGASHSQWLEMWHGFVKDYCKRRLSDVRDRLPAIAGLASKMQSHFDCRYLFGFWDNETFLDHLLWCCYLWVPEHRGSSNSARFPPNGYAPTWSWASCSVNSLFEWDDTAMMYGDVWKLEAMTIALETPNPFGPGHGALHLHSLVVPVFRQSENDPRICYLRSSDDTITSRSEIKIKSRVVFVLTEGDRFCFDDSRVDYDDASDWYQDRQLFFIFSKIYSEPEPQHFTGLLLERLQGTEEGMHIYRRLGYIRGICAQPSEVKDGTSWKPWEPDTDSEIEDIDSEWDGMSRGLEKTTTDSVRAEFDIASELKQIDPDFELDNLTTGLELGYLGTDSEPEGSTEPGIVFARPTWEYWQKLGKWETIVLV